MASPDDSSSGRAELAGYQKMYLRGLAHELEPVVLVGEGGITDAVVKSTQEALTAHELIKVRMRQPPDKKAMARELAERTKSEMCGLIGHTVILYRRHPKKPMIHLPAHSGG